VYCTVYFFLFLKITLKVKKLKGSGGTIYYGQVSACVSESIGLRFYDFDFSRYIKFEFTPVYEKL